MSLVVDGIHASLGFTVYGLGFRLGACFASQLTQENQRHWKETLSDKKQDYYRQFTTQQNTTAWLETQMQYGERDNTPDTLQHNIP